MKPEGDLMGPIRPVILASSWQAIFRCFRVRFGENGRKLSYWATVEVQPVL